MVHGGGSRRGGGGGGGGRARGDVVVGDQGGGRRGGGRTEGRHSGATISSSSSTSSSSGFGGSRRYGGGGNSNRHLISTTTTNSSRHGGGSRTIHSNVRHPGIEISSNSSSRADRASDSRREAGGIVSPSSSSTFGFPFSGGRSATTTSTTRSDTTRHPGADISSSTFSGDDRRSNTRRGAREVVTPSLSSSFGFPISGGRSASRWVTRSFGSIGRGERESGGSRSHGIGSGTSTVSTITATTPSYSYGRTTGRRAGDYVGRESDNDMEEPLLIRPRDYEEDSQEEDCSCSDGCCDGCICLCCACIASAIAGWCFGRRGAGGSAPAATTTATTTNTSATTPTRNHGNGIGNLSRIMIPLSVGTLVLFGILMVVSSSSSSGNTNEWILNAGESRQIQPNWLSKSVRVQATQQGPPNQSATKVSVDLYDISTYNCPPLTGPMVSKRYTSETTLNSGDYQYDYFYLNKGSRMELDIRFLNDDDPRRGQSGQSDVYVLQGEDKIDILRQHEKDHSSFNDHDDSNPFWLDDLLDTAKKSWRNIQSESFWGRFYGTNNNDIYTVLYDNPYTTPAHLMVDLWLYLTTYNLQGYSPTCTMTTNNRRGTNTCPPISHRYFSQCLLIDTTSTASSSTTEDENQEIHIEIIQQRDYFLICILSLIPAILVLGWQIWNRCCKSAWQGLRNAWPQQQRSEDGNSNNNNNNNTNGSTSSVGLGTRDPPYAPHATSETTTNTGVVQPSAPPSSQDIPTSTTAGGSIVAASNSPPPATDANTTTAIPVAEAQVIRDTNNAAAAAVVTTNVEPVPAPTNTHTPTK